MKKNNLTVLFFLASTICFSQENAVPTGGNASGVGGSVSYTIGQIDYVNNSSASGNENQGVQQPFELFMNDLGIQALSNLGVQVYPNPATDYILISSDSQHNLLSYSLVDAAGKLISQNKMEGKKSTVDMRNVSPGNYQLIIYQNTNQIETIKLIKY